MSRAFVIVADPAEADLLRETLPHEAADDICFRAVGQTQHLDSAAKSIMGQWRLPVAMCMNSESPDPFRTDDQRANLKDMMYLGGTTMPYKIIPASPSVLASVFAAPELVGRVLGAPVPPVLARLGLRDPKGVLAELEAVSPNKWDMARAIELMDAADREKIRQTPAVRGLAEFLAGLPKVEGVPVGATA